MAIRALPQRRPVNLRDAVCAISRALAALRANPCSVEVPAAVRVADATLDALEPDVTTVVLRRLLVSITDCHRDGIASSSRLRISHRSAARALRLDGRVLDRPAPRGAGR
jgi:hypothetical protein